MKDLEPTTVTFSSPGEEEIRHIEDVLGHRFQDPSLLITALTRRSFWHENRDTCPNHNERMEFLGDAVLGLIIAETLYTEFPEDEEGELQKKRAGLVNRAALAGLMRRLGLAKHLRMGRGDEISGCRDRDSILSDTLEALIAAVFLDGGFPAAGTMIRKHFYPLIESCATRNGTHDFKSLLQERAQAVFGMTPYYEILEEWGEEHRKTFSIAVMLDDGIAGRGTGGSKKEAAQNAARDALSNLEDYLCPDGLTLTAYDTSPEESY